VRAYPALHGSLIPASVHRGRDDDAGIVLRTERRGAGLDDVDFGAMRSERLPERSGHLRGVAIGGPVEYENPRHDRLLSLRFTS
jgi:hypothetical protein